MPIDEAKKRNNVSLLLWACYRSLLISTVVSLLTVILYQHCHPLKVKTLDLNKVMSAEFKALSSHSEEQLVPFSVLPSVIEKVAGKGSLVLIQQAVVSGAEDITDLVLTEMRLPIEVPILHPKRRGHIDETL
jgi:hypothetical protein